MTEKKHLVLLTEFYPALAADIFLAHDFKLLARKYTTVFVFPITAGDYNTSNIPPNMVICPPLLSLKKSKSKSRLLNVLVCLKILTYELKHNSKPFAFLKNIRYHLAEVKTAIRNEAALQAYLKKNQITNVTFHASFMNIHALTLAIGKQKGSVPNFSFRINGYEIFNDRWINGYLPYEAFIYKNAKKIIANSKASYQYKLQYMQQPEKLEYCYYSIMTQVLAPFSKADEVFYIVSSASVIPLKRVHLIAEAVKLLPFKVQWIHFGAGESMAELKAICQAAPPHISIILAGRTANQELLEFYRTNTVHLFVHTSQSEGLGYALMEAQSFGIPTMACSAGGVEDFVSEQNGTLLPLNITAPLLSNEIIKFKHSAKNTYQYRERLQSLFREQFNNQNIAEKLFKLIEVE